MYNRYKNLFSKHYITSAIILALANIGDTFLYAYLPSNYQNLSLSIIWVGVILSINRFARLFLNSWVTYYLSTRGIKSITIIATVIAVITTVSYGFINSVVLWIVVRILWGITFSTLRLTNIIYSLEQHKKGFALGLSRGIVEIGSIISLLLAPFLLNNFDKQITFSLLGLLSFIGFFLALQLPNIKIETISKKDLILSFPSSFNVIVLLNALIIEGVLVVLVSPLIQLEFSLSMEKSLAIIGFILAYRRVCLVVFSPLTGWLADKFGFEKVFTSTTIILTGGIILIALNQILLGLIIAFTFGAMNSSISVGGAITNVKNSLKDISDNVTWRDIGTAVGTLIGASLLTNRYLYAVFITASILLIASVTVHFLTLKKQNKYNGIS